MDYQSPFTDSCPCVAALSALREAMTVSRGMSAPQKLLDLQSLCHTQVVHQNRTDHDEGLERSLEGEGG